jgi:hypothetical protein
MYGKVRHCLSIIFRFDFIRWSRRCTSLIPDLLTLCKLLACLLLTASRSYYLLRSTAYASFGGLLLSITGSYRHLTNVVLGDPVYVLLRK